MQRAQLKVKVNAKYLETGIGKVTTCDSEAAEVLQKNYCQSYCSNRIVPKIAQQVGDSVSLSDINITRRDVPQEELQKLKAK